MASASSARTCRPLQIMLLGAGRADEARQALRAARAGNDPEQDLGLTEARGLARDPQVARERELEPAAERVAADRRDHRARDRRDRVERVAERAPTIARPRPGRRTR